MMLKEGDDGKRFEMERLRIKIRRQRISDLRRCETELCRHPDVDGDYILNIGSSIWVKLSIEKTKVHLKNAISRLQRQIESSNELTLKGSSEGKSIEDREAAFMEIEEQLDENDNVIEARLNGVRFAPKELDVEISHGEVESPMSQSSPRTQERPIEKRAALGTTQVDVSTLYEFEDLAELLNVSDIKNDAGPYSGSESLNPSTMPESFQDICDQNDSDDSYADNILYGGGLSLIPQHHQIGKRMEEELRKLPQKPRSVDPVMKTTAEKSVRFAHEIEVKTIDDQVSSSSSKARKASRFKKQIKATLNEDQASSLEEPQQPVMRDFITERPDEPEDELKEIPSIGKSAMTKSSASTSSSHAASSTAGDSETQKLVEEYYKNTYMTSSMDSGPIVDTLEDLKKLGSGSQEGTR